MSFYCMDKIHHRRSGWIILSCLLLLNINIHFVQGQTEDDDTVTFELYTQASAVRERIWPVDGGLNKQTSFNPCVKTILIITGFLQGRDNPNIMPLAEGLKEKSNYNVILVNYNTFRYVSAVPIAGEQIAEFLQCLSTEYSLDPANIILWGVSLGSHVAGYASQEFRVGRISAADPAGPLFDFLPDEMRLDRSDTDFLDVVHSDNILGTIRDSMGHVNFIVNDGGIQPGCGLLDLVCSHQVAPLFFMESFTSCDFRFKQCNSYLAFMAGLCYLNPTLGIGLYLDPATAPRDGQKFYYQTDISGSSFCARSELTTPSFDGTIC